MLDADRSRDLPTDPVVDDVLSPPVSLPPAATLPPEIKIDDAAPDVTIDDGAALPPARPRRPVQLPGFTSPEQRGSDNYQRCRVWGENRDGQPVCMDDIAGTNNPDTTFGQMTFVTETGKSVDIRSSLVYADRFDDSDEYEDEIDLSFSGYTAPPPAPPPAPASTQLTPDYSILPLSASADMTDATAKSMAVTSVTSQDPDGIGWIHPTKWETSTWDGNPYMGGAWCGQSIVNIENFLLPSHNDVLRGLREVFYAENPLADVTSPTVAEIDAWNIRIITLSTYVTYLA